MAELNSSNDKGGKDKSEKALKSKGSDVFILRLYVASMSFKSIQAIKNFNDICEESMSGQYDLDIIDISEQPALAREKQIVAMPTLIKETPLPLRRLVGNMSDKKRVLTGLGICSEA